MSVACCDPKKEPAPQQPNEFTLPSREWFRIAVNVPSLVVPATVPDGKLYAFPTRTPPGTSAADNRNFSRSGIAPLLTSAGEWSLYNDGTTPIDVVVFDSRDASATSIYNPKGYTVASHTTVAVAAGPASTSALAANAQRKYVALVNDSSNVMYIHLDAVATPNAGIRLNADGGSLELYGDSLYYGIITFIGTAADNLLITEGV